MSPKKKPKSKKLFFLIFKIFLISLFFLSLPGVDVYQNPLIRQSLSDVQTFPTPALYPQILKNIPPPEISAKGAIVIDLPSQVVLFEKNAKEKFPPASTTKIVTALVALDYYNLEDILEVKTVVNEGRVMGLIPGEKISAENLIIGALVHSANDAAFTLAENYPGGVAAFVNKMNEKVSQLGLSDTHFTDPVGFEDKNQYTTAYDLSQLSRIALLDNRIKKITGIKIISVADKSYSIFHTLENVNALLGKIPGVAGVKTGFTPEAGEVLSTFIRRDDHEVLIVLLKSNNRFGETQELINWIFKNFAWIDLQPTEAIPH